MKLARYLSKHKETVEAFAQRSGVSRATLQRIKQGGARSTRIIEKIVAASGGQVTASDLLNVTRKRSAA